MYRHKYPMSINKLQANAECRCCMLILEKDQDLQICTWTYTKFAFLRVHFRNLHKFAFMLYRPTTQIRPKLSRTKTIYKTCAHQTEA